MDLRLVSDVREGTGRVIDLETDLPQDQRWPVYHALPPPQDSDGDGIPDYWEDQFGLAKNDPADSRLLGAGGYAHIEHYVNNTDPRGGPLPLVAVAATVSRGSKATPAKFKVMRTGDVTLPLTVTYSVTGSALSGKDYVPLSGTVTIPPGAASAVVEVLTADGLAKHKSVIVSLNTGAREHHVGCPRSAMALIRD